MYVCSNLFVFLFSFFMHFNVGIVNKTMQNMAFFKTLKNSRPREMEWLCIFEERKAGRKSTKRTSHHQQLRHSFSCNKLHISQLSVYHHNPNGRVITMSLNLVLSYDFSPPLSLSFFLSRVRTHRLCIMWYVHYVRVLYTDFLAASTFFLYCSFSIYYTI